MTKYILIFSQSINLPFLLFPKVKQMKRNQNKDKRPEDIQWSNLTELPNLTLNSKYISTKYSFLSDHKIHKTLCGLWFWAPDFLIDRLL